MTRPVVLVACSSSKLSHAAPARELYTSDLFRKSRAWAERNGSAWFILSAKHGLVDPERVLEPYDVSLTSMGSSERAAWSMRVARQWEATPHYFAGRVVVLAGAQYRDWTRDRGMVVPMRGLGIGEQKAWLKRQLALEQSAAFSLADLWQ